MVVVKILHTLELGSLLGKKLFPPKLKIKLQHMDKMVQLVLILFKLFKMDLSQLHHLGHVIYQELKYSLIM